MVIQYSTKNILPKLFHPWICKVVQLALAALFIYGGVIKLFDPKAFAAVLSGYDLIPEVLLPAVAIGLPLLETAAGAALAFNRSWGLYIITGLLAMFVVVIGYGMISELNVDCGCFGSDELNQQASLKVAFYRDLLILGLIVPYLCLARRFQKCARSGQD